MNDTQNASQNTTIDKGDLRRMQDVLQSLEDQIRRQTSLKYALLRGAVYGIGTVIGATVLIALLGGIIAMFATQLGEVPLIGDFIKQGALEQYIEQ